jgi:sigma-B regulation protein RsbU (phosphoserine phosphatase)
MTRKILVVDDEPDLEHLVRQKFRQRIRANEFEFLFATNGVDALKKLADNDDVDIVLTDINMPEMDGLTLLTRLKEIESLIKPVIVSAYGDMENIRTAMNRGAYDFLTKPIDLKDLETTLDRTINEVQVLKEALSTRDNFVGLQQELKIATEIQASILPQIFPPFPNRKEFDIFAKMVTAKAVGGDFYDFFLTGKNRIGFVIGDVSGKGIPAAMLMAVSRTLLKATALKGIPPDECMAEISHTLATETLSSMYVTMFYGVLDTRNGTLEYCNAGHNPPYLISENGAEQLENIGGIVAGYLEDFEYESKTIILKPRDTIFLYTDGVTESQNDKEEEFEEKRLQTCLNNSNGKQLPEIIEHVFNAVNNFTSGIDQYDDITTMAVRYNGR